MRGIEYVVAIQVGLPGILGFALSGMTAATLVNSQSGAMHLRLCCSRTLAPMCCLDEHLW